MNKYKWLLPLVMFYMTIKLTTVLTIYRVITIFGINASASTLIIPLWFLVGDIIAEIYGYKIAKKIIWLSIIFQFAFAIICALFAYIPSARDVLQNEQAYKEVLSGLPRVAMASFLAIMTGGIFNAYAINKWRILLKGKYFGLRSLGASSIGELIFTIFAYMFEFFGKTSTGNIIELITVSYLIKLIINPILIIPVTIVTELIKRSEGITKGSTLTDDVIQTQGGSSPKVIEIYTADDNKSYFKENVIETPLLHPLGNYSNKVKVAEMQFRTFFPEAKFDWHTAPQKQYIVYLEGNVSVQASGGETRIFKPGDILLANDITGKGHVTNTLTNGKSIVITTL